MINILAIGNSFSQDATAYLYSIAKEAGKEIKVVNLYIGGCSLETHWRNIINNAALYDYELNGQNTGRKISITEALMEEFWDYVTLQQVSGASGLLDTFYPYITNISDCVRHYAPAAEQLLHQTWAYELDSDHPHFINYDKNQSKMFIAIEGAYQSLTARCPLGLIPSGQVIQRLRSNPVFDYGKGGISLCRDGFHLDLVYGRYAIAATWFEFILKESILENSFLPPASEGKEVDQLIIQLIKETVHKTAQCFSRLH
jgi:hypothetical protein